MRCSPVPAACFSDLLSRPLIFVEQTARPSSLIVFFVGGVTYEEIGIAQDVEDELSGNKTASPKAQKLSSPVIVGGSCVLNSSDYLLALTRLEQRLSADTY